MKGCRLSGPGLEVLIGKDPLSSSPGHRSPLSGADGASQCSQDGNIIFNNSRLSVSVQLQSETPCTLLSSTVVRDVRFGSLLAFALLTGPDKARF